MKWKSEPCRLTFPAYRGTLNGVNKSALTTETNRYCYILMISILRKKNHGLVAPRPSCRRKMHVARKFFKMDTCYAISARVPSREEKRGDFGEARCESNILVENDVVRARACARVRVRGKTQYLNIAKFKYRVSQHARIPFAYFPFFLFFSFCFSLPTKRVGER